MPESKKVVIKVDVHDDKCRRKALKAVSSLAGIESLSLDKDRKLTLIGDIDPVNAVGKLKKWDAEIITVEPAKEDEKKKDEEKKKKDEEKKKEEEKKKKEEEEAIKIWLAAHRAYNPCMTQQYCVHSVEDYPDNNCVIS